MQKIITAMNNPILVEKLKKEKINIIGKDIQYKEGILELLEKEKNINYIFINNKIPGEINLEELIKKINNINKKINIIIFIKKEDKKINKTINNKNIKIIYYDKKIDIEILKKYINKKLNIKNKNNDMKTIIFDGPNGSGKSMTIINLAYYLKNKNKKILILDLNDSNIKNILGIKIQKNKKTLNYKNKFKIKLDKNIKINKYKNKNSKLIKIIKLENKIDLIKTNKKIKIKNFEKYYDYIFIEVNSNIKKIDNKNKKIVLVMEPDLIGIKKTKKIIEKNYKKTKNLKIIINKNNKYSIDENIIKKIFYRTEIIGKINYNEKYTLLINCNFKNNYLLNNKNIIKTNSNIIKNL